MEDPLQKSGVELIRAAVGGDERAWRATMARYAPTIQAIARSHRGLKTRQLTEEDDVSEVVTGTFERLRHDDFKNLRRFLAQLDDSGSTPRQSFDSWLYGAVDFTIRAHLRSRFGRSPKVQEDDTRPRPSKRDLGTHAARLEVDGAAFGVIEATGVTTRLELVQVLRAIEADLTSEEARAFGLYYTQDRSFDEIAEALGLADGPAAEKLVRRINARLRYRFSSRRPEIPAGASPRPKKP